MARGKGRRAFRGPKTLWDLVNDIDSQFAAEVYSLTEEQADQKLSAMSKYQSELEDAQSKDEDLKRLKEQAKVANAGYLRDFKAIKLKRKLIHKVLSERGKT